MFRRKNQPFQPSRSKLDVAISAILDEAINVDSEKAPEHLRLVLLKENPNWKLPERRVARYLKRHLKARKNPKADEIEADMDEMTVYTTLSTATVSKDSGAIPSIANNNSIPENGPDEKTDETDEVKNDVDTEGTADNNDEEAANKPDAVQPVDADEEEQEQQDENNQDQVSTSPEDVVDIEVIVETKDVSEEAAREAEEIKTPESLDEVYVDDNDGGKDQDRECFGGSCVIS